MTNFRNKLSTPSKFLSTNCSLKKRSPNHQEESYWTSEWLKCHPGIYTRYINVNLTLSTWEFSLISKFLVYRYLPLKKSSPIEDLRPKRNSKNFWKISSKKVYLFSLLLDWIIICFKIISFTIICHRTFVTHGLNC